MKRDATSIISISLSVLAGSLLISLAVFLIFGQQRVGRALFFPDLLSDEVHGEQRVVTRRDRQEEAVRLLLEEVILGPADINSSRILPKTTQIQGLFVDEDVVYVDLSAAAIAQSPDVRVEFSRSLDLLRRNVRFNFRNLEKVVITVDGQEPYAPYFGIDEPAAQNLENET